MFFFPIAPFTRLVQEIIVDVMEANPQQGCPLRIERDALFALQSVSENLLSNFFEMT
jgi:histone H3/H4